MSGAGSNGTENTFGEQYAVCELDDCGHVVRSLHAGVLAMKLDDHLQDEHDTTLEEEFERFLQTDTDSEVRR